MSDPSNADEPIERVRPEPPPHPFAEGPAASAAAGRARTSPRRMWFIAGIVALAFTIAVVAFSTIRLQAAEDPHAGQSPLESASPEDLGIDVPPITWPKNMAAGAVVYEGEEMLPSLSDAPADDTAPVPPEIDRGTGPADILLYVDYRCPACVLFEATNGAALEQAVQSGEATLQVQPLTFLDRIDPDDAYSTRAAAAQACVVDHQPELAWTTHELLLDEAFVPPESSAGHSDEALAHAFENAGVGANEEVTSCIASQTFVPFASAMNEWSFQNPVPNANDPSLGLQGTPTVLVNGDLYEGGPGDAEAFQDFLAQHGLSGDEEQSGARRS